MTSSGSGRGYLFAAIAAGSVFALTLGISQARPLFIGAINSQTGIGYASISLAFAIAQLMWGVAQPVAGAIADRNGPRGVMLAGLLLLVAATIATPFATQAAHLILLIGFVAACGAGALGPALLVSASNRWVPEAKRSFTAGIVNAGGSFGQFLLIPFAQLMIGVAGWQPAMMLLGATGLLALPLLLYLTREASAVPGPVSGAESLGQTVKNAVRDRDFLLLNAGFLTCGFHIAFIATHLPGVVASCELPATVSAWSLALIGLFNIFGSLWIGRVIQTARMKFALAWLYFGRACLIVAFFLAPKTASTFLLFSIGIGFTYLSTVPPTIGLVAKRFGPRYVATLFGLVMLGHQVGGFLGAYLGGKAFEASGNYDWMWWADIALCLFAAAVHLPIRETPAPAPAARSAAA